MAITHAVQEGSQVYVYDGDRKLLTLNGELHGYTGGSVSVKEGSMVYTYDERGRKINSTSSR